AAGSAAFCRLAGGLRGSIRLSDHFAWLAFTTLGLLAALGGGFVTAATATAAGVTLGAWATVAVVTALTGAIVIAGRLAVGGGCGLLFAGFLRTAVLGKHADQRLDQALDQAGLGFLDGLVGGGDRRRRRGGRGRRAGVGKGLDRCFLPHDGTGLADLYRLFVLGLGSHGVAGFAIEYRFLVVAQALYVKVGRVHVRVRQDQQAHLGAGFDLRQHVTLLVEQEGGDGHRHVGANLGGPVLQALFLDQAQYRQRQRFNVADGAAAVTAG